MAAKLTIRRDRTQTVLRKLAKDEADSRISRRLLAITCSRLTPRQRPVFSLILSFSLFMLFLRTSC